MDNLTDTIQSSILSVKQKVLPLHTAEMPIQHEGLLRLHPLYDFFGLDFSSRTGRETMDMQRKVKTVLDYITENFDDVNVGLKTLEQQFGARPADRSSLEHFYHGIKYKNQAFESAPKHEQENTYKDKIAQANAQIEAAKSEISKAREEARDVKELSKTTERLARMEERRTLIEAKAKALMESLTPKDGQPTPSPTV